MATHLQNTPFIVYQAGDEDVPHHYPNIGREAMAYLTFLAEYYDCMPEVLPHTLQAECILKRKLPAHLVI